jgi:hypothetical protein
VEEEVEKDQPADDEAESEGDQDNKAEDEEQPEEVHSVETRSTGRSTPCSLACNDSRDSRGSSQSGRPSRKSPKRSLSENPSPLKTYNHKVSGGRQTHASLWKLMMSLGLLGQQGLTTTPTFILHGVRMTSQVAIQPAVMDRISWEPQVSPVLVWTLTTFSCCRISTWQEC